MNSRGPLNIERLFLVGISPWRKVWRRRTWAYGFHVDRVCFDRDATYSFLNSGIITNHDGWDLVSRIQIWLYRIAFLDELSDR